GDRTWLLVSDTLAKGDTPRHNERIMTFPQTDYTPRYHDIGLAGVEIAHSIDYWGHFPIIDMAFNTSAPVEVNLRAWSPFIPGDTVTSMLPAAMFELSVRNTGRERRKGTLAFSFPGFELSKATDARRSVRRSTLDGQLHGVLVESGQPDAWNMAYVLAALDATPRSGGALDAKGSAWARIATHLPEAGEGETGTALALDFDLGPGEVGTYHIVLAWHAPNWRAGGTPSHETTDLHTHMYASHYPNALSAARHMAQHHSRLLRRVIAWQEAIYSDPGTPGWLADSLINILHLITEDSVWGQATAPIGDWCRSEDGVFGLCECPRGCPQIECIPCSFYGNIPLPYFFPQAALSTLRGYKAYQFEDGRPPWIFGGCTSVVPETKPPYGLARPDKGYQTVLNGACHIVMADRYWRVCGSVGDNDDTFLREFWDSLKRCNDFSMNLRPAYGPSQVMAMPTPGTDGFGLGDTEWFEAPEPGWKGYVTHAGAVRMAQVQIMRRMAEAMDDQEYVKKCDTWLDAGAKVLEERLWTGRYYLNFDEPETGLKSDLIFGYQLDGQWITDWHGVPGVFPPERVSTTLQTLREINCALSQSGAVNYANPDGTPAKVGGYGTYSYFTPELYMLAMTFMYGGQREFGLDLLRRCQENLVHWGYIWDAPNTFRGDMDTGQRAFGADYYQNMMLWGVPAALRGEDLSAPAKPGGLVARVLAAGQAA
ncbi:MAG: GH116 family glycosyl hydrolase, partial [Chloroflexi bacterium]|nr:GH116 family glycosyl hydrolase [Chloroflexota bacterium]